VLLGRLEDEALDLVVFLDDVVGPPVVGHAVAQVDQLDQGCELFLRQLDVHDDLFLEKNITMSGVFRQTRAEGEAAHGRDRPPGSWAC